MAWDFNGKLPQMRLLLQLHTEHMPADVDGKAPSVISNGSSSDGDVSRLTAEQKHEMRDYLAAEAAKLEAEARQGGPPPASYLSSEVCIRWHGEFGL